MSHFSGKGIPSPACGPGRKVLVVEDCADMAECWAQLLGAWGHDARVAHDGAEALRAARRQRPDVVLLDVRLPDMDGYEVARRLRTRVGLGEAVIVMVSGYGTDEDRGRGRQAGCDCYLVKPVDLTALEGLLSGPTVPATPRPVGAGA